MKTTVTSKKKNQKDSRINGVQRVDKEDEEGGETVTYR